MLPYTPAVDIRTLVTLDHVMRLEHLGPNGGFVYCIEYLEANLDWLDAALARHAVWPRAAPPSLPKLYSLVFHTTMRCR